jgi:hypothetical protein
MSVVSGVPTYFSLFLAIAAAVGIMSGCAALITTRRRRVRVVVTSAGDTVSQLIVQGTSSYLGRPLFENIPDIPTTESGIIELTTRRLSSMGFVISSQRSTDDRNRARFDLIAAKGDLTLAIEAKARRGVTHDVIAIGQMASEIRAAGGKTIVPFLICRGFTPSAQKVARESGVRLSSTSELLRGEGLGST